MNRIPDSVFGTFFIIIWITFLVSGLFFWLNKNAALKRKLFPYFVLGAGLVMVAFISLSKIPHQVLFVAIPIIVLISFLNIKSVKFCDSCGRTVHSQNPFSPAEYCQKCGAKLQ